MVTDRQVRLLFDELASGKTLAKAAARVDMSERTARRYKTLGKLPGEVAVEHTWRTREDPFEEVWNEASGLLEENPGLQAKTIFEHLQRKYPGRFQDGQVRTLQRRVRYWRATEGPAKEVFFAQVHEPGKLCQSDFTFMTELGVRIGGQIFGHLLYHFVLSYSNWESFTLCYSESFESLSEGLQNALWELGGVPRRHQTDRLSAAVNKVPSPDVFTRRYQGLMGHYGLESCRTNTGKGNENGDVEQRHYRFKMAVDQALMLRGSRDFESLAAYVAFLRKLKDQLNSGRQKRLAEELAVMRPLPKRRLDSYRRMKARVRSGSLITVDRNSYSVPSRLIGETVEVRLYGDHLEVWYAQRRVETLPRLRGRSKHHIQYRHIIDWLVRKPGAFENYRYRADLFPTSRFRMAYDALREASPQSADRQYLKILELAAKESEAGVDGSIRLLLDEEKAITFEAVRDLVCDFQRIPPVTDVTIDWVDLAVFDDLYTEVATP